MNYKRDFQSKPDLLSRHDKESLEKLFILIQHAQLLIANVEDARIAEGEFDCDEQENSESLGATLRRITREIPYVMGLGKKDDSAKIRENRRAHNKLLLDKKMWQLRETRPRCKTGETLCIESFIDKDHYVTAYKHGMPVNDVDKLSALTEKDRVHAILDAALSIHCGSYRVTDS